MFSFIPALKRLLRIGPSISLIVPIYNKAIFLKQCLRSIAEQTFRDFEVICIDDCSSDASFSIARDFSKSDRRFRCYRSKKRLGAGAARNLGIERASGKFLRFIDSDDILPVRSNEILYDLVCNGDVKTARGGILLFDEGGLPSIIRRDIPPEACAYRFADEPRLWIPWWHTSYLISSKMLRQHKIRYPDFTEGEDAVFLAKVLSTADLISSTKEIVYYYRCEGNKSRPEVRDTIAHLEAVRDIYLQYEPKCWFEGYGNYMINEEMPRRLSLLGLSTDVEEEITVRLREMIKPLA